MSQSTRTYESYTSDDRARQAHQLPAEPTLSDVTEQAVASLRQYAKQRPDVVAMWCLGIGFVIGWKLKPW